MKAVLKKVRISPKKANVVAGIVRNMEAEKALAILKFMNKKGAGIIYKLLNSAVSNAENNFSQKRGDLIVSKIYVTEGPTYKRGQSRSKGRVFSLLKRTSNVNVELGVKEIKEEIKSEEEIENKAEENKSVKEK